MPPDRRAGLQCSTDFDTYVCGELEDSAKIAKYSDEWRLSPPHRVTKLVRKALRSTYSLTPVTEHIASFTRTSRAQCAPSRQGGPRGRVRSDCGARMLAGLEARSHVRLSASASALRARVGARKVRGKQSWRREVPPHAPQE